MFNYGSSYYILINDLYKFEENDKQSSIDQKSEIQIVNKNPDFNNSKIEKSATKSSLFKIVISGNLVKSFLNMSEILRVSYMLKRYLNMI